MMSSKGLGMSIISEFIQRTFEPSEIEKLWNTCPNQMLWEAINADDAVFLSQGAVLATVEQVSDVYVLSEPLPAFYQGIEPTYSLVPSTSFICKFSEYAKAEPLYLISNDFSWMIAMTTENTPSGEQLCVLLKKCQFD